ncbi:MAG: lysozyme inhibitor LprI family protein [Aquisalimonadaceae bacterium]
MSIAWITRPALAVWLAAGFAVLAHAGGYGDLVEPCGDTGTEEELQRCIDDHHKLVQERVDKLLDVLYERYREDEPALASLLESSQESWTQFATDKCEVQNYYSRGGTAYEVYIQACTVEQLRERERDLIWMVENP